MEHLVFLSCYNTEVKSDFRLNMGLNGIDRKVDRLVSMQGNDYLLLKNDNQTIIGENNFALAA